MLGRARPDRPPPIPLDAGASYGRTNSYGSSYSRSSRDEFVRHDSAPTTARVKILWTEAKGESSSSTDRKKPASAPTPPVQPPLSIRKREPLQAPPAPVVTPPTPPLAALLPPVLPVVTQPPLATEPLQQRMLKWEAVLSVESLGGDSAIAPPRHTQKRGVGTNEVPAAYRATCAEILKLDPQSAREMSIDKRLWTSWYKEISSLRAVVQHSPPAPAANKTGDKLQQVLKACTAFYSRLVDDLTAMLRREVGDDTPQESIERQRAIRTALHMSLVALGDTARYAQKASSASREPDWSVAQKFYEEALCVLPSNGKVYNQLAFLAISQQQVLRAVYLFARSRACETQFASQKNLAQALFKGDVKDQDALVRSNSVTDVQDRLETLVLSALVVLLKKKSLALGLLFQARADTLLEVLEYYLATCTSMLFAGEKVDLGSIQTVLSQIVCVIIFFVHDFQTPAGSNSDPSISRVAFNEATDSWKHITNVRRLLVLGFLLVGSMMKECEKAVVSPAYMAIAKDLLNTLLPPISTFLGWLQLHPGFLQATEGMSTATAGRDFVCSTVKFLLSISTSLLADRILDEDLMQMSGKLLPEDVELAGFLPLEGKSSERHRAQFRTQEVATSFDDDLLLDIRMCRVLSFSDDFVKLKEKLALVKTKTEVPIVAERSPDASESESTNSSSHEVNSELAEGDDDDVVENEEEDEAVALVAGQRADVVSKSEASKAHRCYPLTSKHRSPPRTSTSTDDHLEAQEESLAFAAVMSIGADRNLYDTSSGTQNRAAPKCLIVIDVSNVAMRHGLGKKFSSSGVRIACDYYLQRGHRVVGFLPDYLLNTNEVEARRRKASAGTEVSAAKIPDDVALLQTMVEEGILIPTPSQDYDDSYCIQYAGMYDGCVLTNDMYRDHIDGMDGPRERKVAMRMWLAAHLISFTWVRNEFLPNPDFRYPKPARL